jgi:hypothetical protein
MFRVTGGLSGYVNQMADETTRTDCFDMFFHSREEALAKARELAGQLRPGGLVYCFLDDPNNQGMLLADSGFVGLVSRSPDSGEWFVNPDGLDLRN